MIKSKSELRELQIAELKILKDIKNVCEKNNIIYFLDSGTLLGAVRHKGFIPWDDDIDISMPYEDYVRFCEIAQNELGPDYFLQTSETDKNYYVAFAKVRRNNTTALPMYFKDWHVHHGVWVDIFPIVGVRNELDFKLKKVLLKICNGMLMEDRVNSFCEKEINEFGRKKTNMLKAAYRVFSYKFRKLLRAILLKLIYKDSKRYNFSIPIFNGLKRKFMFPKEVFFGDIKHLEFEGESFPVPGKYNDYLVGAYGDYMELPPENERYGHGNVIIDLNTDYSVYVKKLETGELNEQNT